MSFSRKIQFFLLILGFLIITAWLLLKIIEDDFFLYYKLSNFLKLFLFLVYLPSVAIFAFFNYKNKTKNKMTLE